MRVLLLLLNYSTINLVQPVGIEPTSTTLQAAAMTTSAKVAYFGAHVQPRTESSTLRRLRTTRGILRGRILFGAPRQNRTAIHGLQNRYTSIVLVGRIVFQRPPILVEGTQWFVSYGGGLAFFA